MSFSTHEPTPIDQEPEAVDQGQPRRSFPRYFRHRDARCFGCGTLLHDLEIAGYAPGSGQYKGTCARCAAANVTPFTWYDCAEGGVELAQTNDRREAAWSTWREGDETQAWGEAP